MCRFHNLFNHFSQQIKVTGGGGSRWRIGSCLCLCLRSGFADRCVRSQFVQAHCDCLSKIHRGLSRVRGNLDEHVAIGEVFARQAVFFRPEDERNSAAACQFIVDE